LELNNKYENTPIVYVKEILQGSISANTSSRQNNFPI